MNAADLVPFGTQDTAAKIFGNKIANIAISNYPTTGILPSVVTGQAVLESNYGQSDLARLYNNPFGMKASTDKAGNPIGNYVNLKTHEEINGKSVPTRANFAVYSSLDEAYNHYVSNMKNVFPAVFNAKDYTQVLSVLVDGNTKYATDSSYKKKVSDIIQQYNLNALDTGQVPVAQKSGNIIEDTVTGIDKVNSNIVNAAADAVNAVPNFLNNSLPKYLMIGLGVIVGIIGIMYLFNNEGGEE